MGDIQTRPFSRNYSGLINQSVIALGITVLCVTGQELMKRRRRGKGKTAVDTALGSRESWEFGYLYQGRSWAKTPSPPTPRGWPLSWVPQVVRVPESKMNELRGVDATLYIRFLRGCFWFTLLHTFTTFPILFPIHLEFSESGVSAKSMTRASISSLVLTARGQSLLWIHICLLFWITFTWMANLFWICHGAFMLRADSMELAAQRVSSDEGASSFHPHPHPQYGFTEVLPLNEAHTVRGLRLRTIMVSNLLPQLRDEKELKEYFEYYMSRELEKPAIGLNGTTQPGFVNKSVAFLFNHAKRLPAHLPLPIEIKEEPRVHNKENIPVIERVVVARKMTELASLLERREEILRHLETAHIQLAKKTLEAVARAMDQKEAHKPFSRSNSRAAMIAKKRKTTADVEVGDPSFEENMSEEDRMEQLIKVLGPFVEEFGVRKSSGQMRRGIAMSKHTFRKLRTERSQDSDDEPTSPTSPEYPPTSRERKGSGEKLTIWEALLSVPRSSLDAYQPLVNLSHIFRGKTVPSIDYYTVKLNLLTSLITENRAREITKYDPVSTAFVTFAYPADAMKACKFLTVHPHNPLACMVTMAPAYQDLDWIRVMKSSFNAEFLKDWIVSLGVWAFTVFWLFPVSLLVGLVSIQNISTYLPKLKTYLDRHPWEEEVIQSFVPTLLVALLALLIPLILLLIGKKAHTITTLSALHDRIMTRYYKFLIVNVLVFFCVGTAALQSVLASFKVVTSGNDVLKIVADSFPTAGPFYVGWLIFTTAMHGGFEIALFGLPLIMYPKTTSQVTPRKRAMGIRPRTLNYYYWLPTHMLVIHVLLLFAVLNPFVIPFAAIYFFIESGVIKNQLLHVYAKNYEGNGKLILIRIVRYSLDGLILSQTVFLAYMVVLKKTVNVGLSAVLIIITAAVKLIITRMCRAQFDLDDMKEARMLCTPTPNSESSENGGTVNISDDGNEQDANALLIATQDSRFTWRMPAWVAFSWSSVRHKNQHHVQQRGPNPFRDGPGLASKPSQTPVVPAEPTDTTRAVYHPSAINYRWPEPERSASAPTSLNSDESKPVAPHPAPVAWDDQTTADLPYDNPFYTRQISDFLWLPRNPCGPLDLDDTVDLKVSLSVDLTAPKLGTWTAPETISSQVVESSEGLSPSRHYESPSELSVQDYDGTESIELPPSIAKRVENREEGFETVAVERRPSTFRQRVSSGTSAITYRRPSSTARPSTGSRPQPRSFRSFSEGTHSPRQRSQSFMSIFETPGMERGQSNQTLRPDAQAQADFVAAHSSSSRLSLPDGPPKLKRAQNVSAHHAIVREIVAEEEHAFLTRVTEEQEEAEKAAGTKSWLTSWMFNSSRRTPPPTPDNSAILPTSSARQPAFVSSPEIAASQLHPVETSPKE
ncbi:hypothetical protein C8J56DRAFT_911019 [Mycena floridula]|nr:hypothetical protein C8J56DRAFT_911019 [Mycena floridula]